jgi:RNA polymerase sigma factor (sigma-70 family)
MFDEREVIGRVLKNEPGAFELLVKHYENLVFCIARRMACQQEDVEDVCQEVFVKVHQHLRRFNFQSRLSTWIARITYTTCINYLRKHRKDNGEWLQEVQLAAEASLPDDPGVLLAKSDTAAYVNALVAELPGPFRTVLTLFHLQEFSYVEIENITGMPQGTVKSYLFRARKLLKEKVEHYLKNEKV